MVSSKQEKTQVGSLTLLSALLGREVLDVGENGSGLYGVISFLNITPQQRHLRANVETSTCLLL